MLLPCLATGGMWNAWLRLALLTGCIVGKSASRKGDHDHATEQEGFFRLHLFLRSPVNTFSRHQRMRQGAFRSRQFHLDGSWLQRLAGKVDIVNLMAAGLLRVLA